MKVFVENEAGSYEKNIFDEKSLEYKKAIAVSREYPFPYGFVLDTISGDGDCLDCFVVTSQKIKSGQIVECEPIGIMEQVEDGKEDNNILAKLENEEVVLDEKIKGTLTEFISHVFDHRVGKMMQVGGFLGKQAAIEHIDKCKLKLRKKI